MLNRRGLLGALSGLVLLSACAGAGAPRDAKGDPLEPLTVTTASGIAGTAAMTRRITMLKAGHTRRHGKIVPQRGGRGGPGAHG